jgi:hypothetical protein
MISVGASFSIAESRLTNPARPEHVVENSAVIRPRPPFRLQEFSTVANLAIPIRPDLSQVGVVDLDLMRHIRHADRRQRSRCDDDQVDTPVDRLEEIERSFGQRLDSQVALAGRVAVDQGSGEIVNPTPERRDRLEGLLEDQFGSQVSIVSTGRFRPILDRLTARLHE